MNSILLCEGSTDYVLLQYYMREVYGWKDCQEGRGPKYLSPSRIFSKEGDHLVIGGTGGSTQMIPKLEKILENNRISALEEEEYRKIAIVTDHDELTTESELVENLKEIFEKYSLTMREHSNICTGKWISASMKNARDWTILIKILILVIPFEETGAMETFLLDSISKKDEYDAEIIRQGNKLVDSVDPEERYLYHRRYITKAKFDVYFSIRTPAAFFTQRQDILRGIEWKEYEEIQRSFVELGEL